MRKKDQEKTTAKAISKYIRISPIKVRRVLTEIKGRSYWEAAMVLDVLPYRACGPIWQTLDSAVGNAKNKFGVEERDLQVKTVFANQGPSLRRFRPRAQGRGYQIRKPTCHITVIVENISKSGEKF
uniref:Large ribosomal subunit protein uL22c n=1 Tax=Ishige okamurae TaxID=233772 RepID=A0A8E5XRM7_9PHAE|nr:ribosomal protein L22 [Ishige okamurae]QVJ99699.1 ribosomal protein L22 [Ishige okamurae]